jgi:hypothetical protein
MTRHRLELRTWGHKNHIYRISILTGGYKKN